MQEKAKSISVKLDKLHGSGDGETVVMAENLMQVLETVEGETIILQQDQKGEGETVILQQDPEGVIQGETVVVQHDQQEGVILAIPEQTETSTEDTGGEVNTQFLVHILLMGDESEGCGISFGSRLYQRPPPNPVYGL